MALPASGQITLNQVNVELGLSGTAQIGMNDAAVRGLFGIASGEIEMSDGYGKSSAQTAHFLVVAGGGGGSVVRLAVVVQGVFVPLIMPVPLAEAEVLSLQCH